MMFSSSTCVSMSHKRSRVYNQKRVCTSCFQQQCYISRYLPTHEENKRWNSIRALFVVPPSFHVSWCKYPISAHCSHAWEFHNQIVLTVKVCHWRRNRFRSSHNLHRPLQSVLDKNRLRTFRLRIEEFSYAVTTLNALGHLMISVKMNACAVIISSELAEMLTSENCGNAVNTQQNEWNQSKRN